MLKLYNTLGRKKEVFKPIKKNSVGLYTCGPTVYDYAHIGNLRAYICSDLLKKYLQFKGFKVKHVMNITDVDDKTIKASIEQKISLKKFTLKYTKAFFEDLKKLNISKADKYPKATEHITEMVKLIKALLKKGLAYKSDDGIYFSVSKDKKYGQLSKLKFEDLETGKRVCVDEYSKKQARDFVLWKFWNKNDGNVFWETSFGKGRPGWHIECSAMSTKYLGQPFDIHTGGIDLVFPHHENEIAQSEGAYGKKFVKYWVHNEYLLVNGKKMSKSLGNYFTLRDLIAKGYDVFAVKYVLMCAHYRQQLNFTLKSLESAKNSLSKLKNKILEFKKDKGKLNSKSFDKYLNMFVKELDNDLNVPKALAVLWQVVSSKLNGKTKLSLIKEFDKILSLGLSDVKAVKVPEAVLKLARKRDKLRKLKKWKDSDKIRSDINKKGWDIQDTKSGFVLKKK